MLDFLTDFYNSTSIIDLLFLVIMLLSLIKCYKKGFVLSVLAMAKWLLAYIVAVCIFSGIHIVYNYDKWPINEKQSYVFPYLKKGSNYLVNEFPNEETYQDSKEKIEGI